MEHQINKVVILGPESTGKSTLCKQLAEHFDVAFVPEYARQFLEENGTDYTYEDLLLIAKGQIALEEKVEHSSGNNLFFVDTDMHVMKVWCEYVFGKCHEWILEQVDKRQYDLYLLCKNDLPWVKDSMREYPDPETREKLFRMYEHMMISEKLPYVVIHGNYDERLKIAIAAVQKNLDV